MGFDGPVALNMLAIDKAMDDFNVDADERILFSTTVRKIASIVFSTQRKARQKK